MFNNELRDMFKSKQAKAAQDKLDQAAEKDRMQKEKEEALPGKIAEKTAKSKADREQAYQEGTKRYNDLMNGGVEGLKKEDRDQMQYEANKGIQRSMQSANRKLLGDQGMHGISGKSGVAFAQNKDLINLGVQAQNQSLRDINKLDEQQRMKNVAALFAAQQGEASQAQLDYQRAIDEIELADEKKRQQDFDEKFNQLFSRI